MKLHDCVKYYDYIPIALITLLFITETDLERHAMHKSCNLCINIISIVCFYCILLHFEKSKHIAFISSIIIWAVLFYIKENHLF